MLSDIDGTFSASGTQTVLLPRYSRNTAPARSSGVAWVTLLLLVTMLVVGVLRLRSERAATATPRMAPALAPAPAGELPVIAPRPSAEPASATEAAPAKKKRRPKESAARRSIERLQREQLARAGAN